MTDPTSGAAIRGPVATADTSQVIAQNTSQAVSDLSNRMGGVDPQLLNSIMDAVVGGYLNGDGALMTEALGAYTQLASAVQAAQLCGGGGQQATPLPGPGGESAPPTPSASEGMGAPTSGAPGAGPSNGDLDKVLQLLAQILALLPPELLNAIAQAAQNGQGTSGAGPAVGGAAIQ